MCVAVHSNSNLQSVQIHFANGILFPLLYRVINSHDTDGEKVFALGDDFWLESGLWTTQ